MARRYVLKPSPLDGPKPDSGCSSLSKSESGQPTSDKITGCRLPGTSLPALSGRPEKVDGIRGAGKFPAVSHAISKDDGQPESEKPASSDFDGCRVSEGSGFSDPNDDSRKSFSINDENLLGKPGFGGTADAVSGLVNCAINDRKLDCNLFLRFIYDQAPVVGFRVLKNDVVTVRAARYPDELAERLEGAVRGQIEYLSMRSRRRLALRAGNSEVVMRSFITVSYPAAFPCDGRIVKLHLSMLLKSLRRYCGPLEYLWFLEFQARGAPHLHMFLDYDLPSPRSVMKRRSGRRVKEVKVHWPSQDWLSQRWFEIVGSGDEKHLAAGSAWEVVEKPDGAARYVAKESYKTFQKVVPAGFQNVGRFWGTSRGVKTDEGKMVYASVDQMKAVFGPACFDSEGNPFPVLFSASGEYRKIRDTVRDPVKIREWQSGHSQKTAPWMKEGHGWQNATRMARPASVATSLRYSGASMNSRISRRNDESAALRSPSL